MRRALWILLPVLLPVLLLAGCGQEADPPADGGEEPDGYEALIASAPIAQVEGEAVSPDGRFELRAEGASGEYVSGVQPPEFLRIVDRETGEVLWEDRGYLWQSILWSPRGEFAALAVSARTWHSVTVFETENWTSWDFTLPDGGPIPEYTFLDGESWGVWLREQSLAVTLDQGDSPEPKKYYICRVETADGKIRGNTWEESREALPGEWDFNHDGKPDAVELARALEWENGERKETGWYELRVRLEDGVWSQEHATSHAGWGSFFAKRVDGKDYLLRYNPTMYQGIADYEYQLFSLREAGEEQTAREGSVEFDINFGSPMHESYDPEAIAAFLEEVRGLLEDSELLVTTEDGEFRSGGPGADFKDDLSYWTDDPLYDDERSLEENLRLIGEYLEEMMTAG